jgi:ataxia telangiectasia mutated family protein
VHDFENDWLIFCHSGYFRDDLLSSDFSMDQHLRDFLEPYIAEEGAHLCPSNQNDQCVQLRAIDDRSLWVCEGLYGSWICCLAHALCLYNIEHMVWPKCAYLCSLKPSFAELLFPHLLLEVYICSRKPGQGHLKNVISNLLETCILAPDNSNITAVQLVIRALEFFNAFRCEMVQHRGVPFADEVLAWERCYWFEISFFVAARAALRCGAPLTSFLFLERLSSEKGFSNGSDNTSVLNKRGALEELMMKVYQSIDEPDGNAAFDKGFELASVAFANERDEEWWRALGVFDVGMMNHQDFDHGVLIYLFDCFTLFCVLDCL